ncbi:MAG: D-glucuronyl C5-epimerase family protein [Pseudomonadales bacterium]
MMHRRSPTGIHPKRIFRICALIISALSTCLCTTATALPAQTIIDGARHVTNEKGIPSLEVPDLGTIDHPAWIALYALAYAGVENYQPALRLTTNPKGFRSCIDWLEGNLQENGAGLWVWPYLFNNTYNNTRIDAPWASAFAQATGIQAFLAAYRSTGDRKYISLAGKAAKSLTTTIEKGGLMYQAGDAVWFEEIPEPAANPSHILNGHMRAIIALQELVTVTGDTRLQKWVEKGRIRFEAGRKVRYRLLVTI